MTSNPNSGTGVNSVSTSINNGVCGFTVTLPAGASASATITVTPPGNVQGLTFGPVNCNVWNPGSNSSTYLAPTGSNQFTVNQAASNPNGGTYLVQVFQTVSVSTNPPPAQLFTTFMNPSVSPATSGQTTYAITDTTLAILTGGGSNATVMTVNVQINGGGGAPDSKRS